MLQGPGILVALEDTDPYRDCYHRPAAPRLSEAEFGALARRQFRAAWREIERDRPAYAPALAAGLSTLMPLAAPRMAARSARPPGPAFGAVAMALPADPVSLALLLIQEFQHVKLGAVLDLYDLYDPADDRFFPPRGEKASSSSKGSCGAPTPTWRSLTFWRARQQFATGPSAERRAGCSPDAAPTLRSDRDPAGFGLADAARDVVRPGNV